MTLSLKIRKILLRTLILLGVFYFIAAGLLIGTWYFFKKSRNQIYAPVMSRSIEMPLPKDFFEVPNREATNLDSRDTTDKNSDGLAYGSDKQFPEAAEEKSILNRIGSYFGFGKSDTMSDNRVKPLKKLASESDEINGSSNPDSDTQDSNRTKSATLANAPRAVMANPTQGQRSPPGYLVDRTPLPLAPDLAITQETEVGPVPTIGKDGRKAWTVYAKPVGALAKSRIAVVVGFLGGQNEINELVVNKLPGMVTVAIDPYVDLAAFWMAKARANGHESLLGLPLESLDYPRSDPGPAALLTSLDSSVNQLRLNWLMSRAVGYVGFINMGGAKFLAQPRATIPLLTQLHNAGVMMVIDGSEPNRPAGANQATQPTRQAMDSKITTRMGRLARDLGVPRALVDLRINDGMNRDEIKNILLLSQSVAKENGQSVVFVVRPTSEIVSLIGEWVVQLDESKYSLVPISALADKQADKPVVDYAKVKKAQNFR